MNLPTNTTKPTLASIPTITPISGSGTGTDAASTMFIPGRLPTIAPLVNPNESGAVPVIAPLATVPALPVVTPPPLPTVVTAPIPALPVVTPPPLPTVVTAPIPSLPLPTVVTAPIPSLPLPTVAGVNIPLPVPSGIKAPAPVPAQVLPRGPVSIPLPTFNSGPAPKPTLDFLYPKPKTRSILPNPFANLPREELILREWQTEWANRALAILRRHFGYIDTSLMGAGKTYVLLWLAQQLRLKVLVVSPVIMMSVWQKTAAKYGVELVDVISYQSLRSVAGVQPKHGFLHREDYVTPKGSKKVNFTVTDAYLNLIQQQGVIVVFDEVQNVKNNSSQHKSCSALLRPILEGGGTSRFALLSATPFDKQEHSINILKLTGYIRSTRMYTYNKDTKELTLEGAQELIDACMRMDPVETNRILELDPPDRNNITHLSYELYRNVIKAHISGAMPSPTNIQGRNDVKNGFFHITGENQANLRNAVNELAEAANFDRNRNAAELRDDNIGEVTTALVNIEKYKAFDFARVATKIIAAHPEAKVIISVNYNTSIEIINSQLILFAPIILTGSVPAPKRSILVDKFNTDPNVKILIMNTTVGGVGISLHDTVGDAPRYMLASPSYKLIELVQAAPGRIRRDGTMSDTTTRLFYGEDDGALETNILTALARKSGVLKGTLDEIVLRDLVLPGDYESEIEDSEGQTLF